MKDYEQIYPTFGNYPRLEPNAEHRQLQGIHWFEPYKPPTSFCYYWNKSNHKLYYSVGEELFRRFQSEPGWGESFIPIGFSDYIPDHFEDSPLYGYFRALDLPYQPSRISRLDYKRPAVLSGTNRDQNAIIELMRKQPNKATFVDRSIFDIPADAWVNPINCDGIWGKGLALEFKDRFPEVHNACVSICAQQGLNPGDLHIHDRIEREPTIPPRYIINFPTKLHWREKSKLSYIRLGLKELTTFIKTIPEDQEFRITIPRLGCGLGGLNWEQVKLIITKEVESWPLHIIVYIADWEQPKSLYNQIQVDRPNRWVIEQTHPIPVAPPPPLPEIAIQPFGDVILIEEPNAPVIIENFNEPLPGPDQEIPW